MPERMLHLPRKGGRLVRGFGHDLQVTHPLHFLRQPTRFLQVSEGVGLVEKIDARFKNATDPIAAFLTNVA